MKAPTRHRVAQCGTWARLLLGLATVTAPRTARERYREEWAHDLDHADELNLKRGDLLVGILCRSASARWTQATRLFDVRRWLQTKGQRPMIKFAAFSILGGFALAGLGAYAVHSLLPVSAETTYIDMSDYEIVPAPPEVAHTDVVVEWVDPADGIPAGSPEEEFGR
ncbi:hypothetical protein BCY76_013055 [Nesterenkonia sp. PF2B19]|nr:hypothetical protein BCY76_013055 [Nesterenkonia sp. PF2B19]